MRHLIGQGLTLGADSRLARPRRKRQSAIRIAPTVDGGRQDFPDLCADFGNPDQDLRRRAELLRRCQSHHFVGIVADQLQIDDGVQSSGDQPRVARDRRLQRDQGRG